MQQLKYYFPCTVTGSPVIVAALTKVSMATALQSILTCFLVIHCTELSLVSYC